MGMKTTASAKQIRQDDIRTAQAVNQKGDAFGAKAVAFGAINYHEGTIVHRGSIGVVVASGGKFYAARRTHFEGSSFLTVIHTARTLDGAVPWVNR